MFGKILAPLDGSDLAEAVLPAAQQLLGGPSPELVLVRVVEPKSRSEQEDDIDAARAYLDALVARLAPTGLRVRARLERGDSAEQVLAAVAEERPELVVMATHGRTGVERWVRGSVAERVLRHCHAPLLLWNPRSLASEGGALFARILVPLDGSPRADAVLSLVARFAATAPGARVSLLRVEPFVQGAVPSPMLVGPSWDPAKLRATLEPQRQRLADLGVEATIEVAVGLEAGEILAAAERADLVAMSTHGRSGPSRWWFGSVAEQVLRHCSRPVLVVRAADDDWASAG